MGVQWYYGRGSDITGPISGRELSALVGTGELIVTDTVWQEGNENGVKAGRVKNLFPIPVIVVETPPIIVETPPVEPVFVAEVVEVVVVSAVVAPVYQPLPKQGRARAGKGAVLVNQDGKTVKFRMKCSECGREDSNWKSISIPRGVYRTSFYCTTCRKKRDAEIHGSW